MWFNTTKVFLTAGIAEGGQALNAFDNALRNAKIADFNLIKVTSIVPPGIPVYHLPEKIKPIRGNGLLIPTIYESIHSNELGQEISAGVGVGITIPAEKGAGIIFTYSCFGTDKFTEKIIRQMVKEGMRAKGYLKHRCEVAIATSTVKRHWTCAMAAAVFCDKDLEKLFPIIT